MASHFRGPLLGDRHSLGGALDGAPQQLVLLGNGYRQLILDFSQYYQVTNNATPVAHQFDNIPVGTPTAPALTLAVLPQFQNAEVANLSAGTATTSGAEFKSSSLGVQDTTAGTHGPLRAWFSSRLCVNDVSTGVGAVGLGSDLATQVTTAGAGNATAGFLFRIDASGNVLFNCADISTDTGVDVTDAEVVDLAFNVTVPAPIATNVASVFDVNVYVNGVRRLRLSDTDATGVACMPFMSVVNNSTTPHTMQVAWLGAATHFQRTA